MNRLQPSYAAVPSGLYSIFKTFPTDESVGYCQLSLRDKMRNFHEPFVGLREAPYVLRERFVLLRIKLLAVSASICIASRPVGTVRETLALIRSLSTFLEVADLSVSDFIGFKKGSTFPRNPFFGTALDPIFLRVKFVLVLPFFAQRAIGTKPSLFNLIPARVIGCGTSTSTVHLSVGGIAEPLDFIAFFVVATYVTEP